MAYVLAGYTEGAPSPSASFDPVDKERIKKLQDEIVELQVAATFCSPCFSLIFPSAQIPTTVGQVREGEQGVAEADVAVEKSAAQCQSAQKDEEVAHRPVQRSAGLADRLRQLLQHLRPPAQGNPVTVTVDADLRGDVTWGFG